MQLHLHDNVVATASLLYRASYLQYKIRGGCAKNYLVPLPLYSKCQKLLILIGARASTRKHPKLLILIMRTNPLQIAARTRPPASVNLPLVQEITARQPTPKTVAHSTCGSPYSGYNHDLTLYVYFRPPHTPPQPPIVYWQEAGWKPHSGNPRVYTARVQRACCVFPRSARTRKRKRNPFRGTPCGRCEGPPDITGQMSHRP